MIEPGPGALSVLEEKVRQCRLELAQAYGSCADWSPALTPIASVQRRGFGIRGAWSAAAWALIDQEARAQGIDVARTYRGRKSIPTQPPIAPRNGGFYFDLLQRPTDAEQREQLERDAWLATCRHRIAFALQRALARANLRRSHIDAVHRGPAPWLPKCDCRAKQAAGILQVCDVCQGTAGVDVEDPRP